MPRAFVTEGVDEGVRRAFDAALETLREAGATLVDIELPHAKYAIPVYYLVATAEASSNLARYDGVRYGHRGIGRRDDLKQMYSRTRDEGFGAEVKRRIMLGTYVLSAGYYDAFYLKAQQVRTLLRRDYEQAFARVDVVAMPTSPTPAFRLGEKTEDPLQMYLADIFTVSANLAGLPGDQRAVRFCTATRCRSACSSRRMFDEETLLRVADAYQRITAGTRNGPASEPQTDQADLKVGLYERPGSKPQSEVPSRSPLLEPALERVDDCGSPSRPLSSASPTRSRSRPPRCPCPAARRQPSLYTFQ